MIINSNFLKIKGNKRKKEFFEDSVIVNNLFIITDMPKIVTDLLLFQSVASSSDCHKDIIYL